MINLISTRSRTRPQQGVILVGLGIFLFIIAATLIFLPFFLFGKVVRPDEIGLRQNYFGVPFWLREGYQEGGLAAGLHWQIPFISLVHVLPRDLLVVNFSDKALIGDLDLPPLEVPTEEGAKMKVDATLVIRYYPAPDSPPHGVAGPGARERVPLNRDSENVPIATTSVWQHQGPSTLVNSLGLQLDNQLRYVATSAQGVMKDSLGLLSTAKFYDPALREEAAFKASAHLNEELAPKGIEVWATLVRRYQYPEAIDDRIFEKNLELQKRKFARSAADVMEIEKATTEFEAQQRQLIEDSRQRAFATNSITLSEATLYEGQKRAEGDLLVNQVEAVVFEAKRDALRNESGARVLTALEALPQLRNLKGGIVSGVEPFNVDGWISRLGGKAEQ